MKIANLVFGCTMAALIGFPLTQTKAATYTCTVEKTTEPHPYLPERIEFLTDDRFQAVTVTDVKIKNVTTFPSKGLVVNRTRKRLRLSWPSSEYVVQGHRPRQAGSIGQPRPEQYRYTLSLNLAKNEFITRIADKRFVNQPGSARGHCQVSE